jgi:hypothetical protein
MARLLDRAVSGLLLAFTIVATVGVAVLLTGGVVPGWLLPGALILGGAAPRRPELVIAATKENRWLLLAVIAVLLVVFAALSYGAMATLSRHWDGAIAWDLKASFLTENPTLSQPFFQSQHVIHHSRDYPLLQPLLVALTERAFGAGRVVFPIAWMMAASAVLLMLRRQGASWTSAGLGAVAFACTPMLISPTSGSVDSGYAEATLAAWLTMAAVGCVLKDARWIVCGVILVSLTKPEGVVYAALLLGASWLQGCRGVLRPAALGCTIGVVLLLFLQHELQFVDRVAPPIAALLLPVLSIGGMVWADAYLARKNRWRLRLAAALVIVGACASPWLVELSGNPSGSLARYMQDLLLVWQRLELVPVVIWSVLDYGVLHGWFGLSLPILALTVWRNRQTKGRTAPPALGLWLLLCVPCWCAAFLISDLELAQHLRSRLPRLMLHAIGLAWVYILATWQCSPREGVLGSGHRAVPA